MDNQSSTGGSIVAVKKNGEDLVDEQIDERILRLLGLEYIFDIDYDTYTSLLKEKMVAARMAKTQIPTEEAELLTNEYKKIRGKKGRFKVKKITAQSLKRGSAVGVNLGKQKALVGKPLKALPPADKMTGGSDIKEIIDALAEIIKSLTSQNKLAKDSAEKSRIAGEAGQRGAKESRLEKGFKFAIKAAEKIIAPIKSLLDRIIDFFVAIFVGRALIKLLDWFSDSKNQDKIKAIGRFLGDQWPKLLALYIMFGTGLGKFVGFLTKIVIRGGIKLAAAAAGLLAKAGVGKAAGAAKFLGGKYGKLLGAGLEVAATVGTTMAVSKGIENFGGIGGEEQKTQGYSGGGFVIPKFAGGGLNFKGMMGGAGMGAMFGPLGMLLGAGLGSGKIQETVSGLIGGKKGVDKVPAMLTDGEFVMSRGAVQKYGVDTLESMNAAGGGTNQPKIVSGTTYAKGGGLVKMQGGGFLDTLGGLGVPGTGTIMAPRSSGPRDIRGNQQTDPGFQSKFLGIPLGSPTSGASSRFGMTAPLGPGGDVGGYTEAQKKRYTSRTGSSFVPTSYAGSISGAMGDSHLRFPGLPSLQNKKIEIPDYMMPSQTSVSRSPKKPNLIRESQDTASKLSAISREKIRMTNELLGRGSATETNYLGATKMLGNQLGYSNRAEQIKRLKEQGLLPKKQGGGLFGGTKTPSTEEHPYLRQVRLEKAMKGLPPGKGFTGKYDMHGNPTGYGVRGGGLIRENTGIDIPGGGADRQNVRVQPGEYIIPKRVVDTVGVNLLDKRVANIDKNSNPSKLGAGRQIEPQSPPISRLNPAQIQTQNNVPKINPPSKSKVKVVYATSPGGMPKLNTSSGASPSVPSFSAVHPNSESRRRSAAVLGVK